MTSFTALRLHAGTYAPWQASMVRIKRLLAGRFLLDHSNRACQTRSRIRHGPIVAAGRRDPYEVLGIPKSSNLNEAKRAYRKLALKLHPDVNKAPDAREKFMACKNAYQEIADRLDGRSTDQTSTQFDRGTDEGWTGGSWNQGRSQPRSRGATSGPQAEDFYGLGDLFNDLSKEWDAYSRQRSQDATSPKSLWEELADLGEEFIEFLEKNAPISPDHNTVYQDEANYNASRNLKEDQGRPPQSGVENKTRSDQSRAPPPPAKRREEVIEDELLELKKKLGLG